ncbi:MAG: hypothetical protein QM766_21985 [Burkholderiaceae bacterium]
MPITYEPITAPGFADLVRELQLPLDTIRWRWQWLGATRRRASEPRRVVLLPGYGAGESSLLPMAAYLRGLGHDVSTWGLGRNTGNVEELLAGLPQRLAELHGNASSRVSLVGWSLGGYLAREAARDRPELVDKVITLGSPVIGGPCFTTLARWFEASGHDLARVESEVAARYDRPLDVPVTAIYSKRDGIVAWQACIDHWSSKVRHIEVAETHLGMGFAPSVLSLVGRELDGR